jgi:hypothetical protein
VTSSDKNGKPDEREPARAPSTGEGADSALDAMRKKRREVPPPDTQPPPDTRPPGN